MPQYKTNSQTRDTDPVLLSRSGYVASQEPNVSRILSEAGAFLKCLHNILA